MTSKPNNKSPTRSTMKYLAMIVALAPSVGAFHGNPLVMSVTTTTTSTSSPRRSASMTRLQYISGAEQDHTSTAAAPGTTWFSGIFGGGREQSSAADEYLEFLDKRYNSILKDGEAEESKGFSVMDWLYPNGREETISKQQQEDALYVLGVANLASKKFLQRRHRLPPPEVTPPAKQSVASRKNAIVVTDAEIVVEPKTIHSAPVAAAVTVFQEVARRREALIQKQTKGFRCAMAVLVRSILTGPARAMEKLFVMGGGKQSLAMTCAALAAVSFLLRPLLRVAAVEGAKSIRP